MAKRRGVGFIKKGGKCRRGLKKKNVRVKGKGTRIMCVLR